MLIYCCQCEEEVYPRLTNGWEIYPHRKDLKKIPFWVCELVCESCGNYVGCHHNTSNHTKPLGCIPTHEIREVRKAIHQLIDPLWKNGLENRSRIYSDISKMLGYQFHEASIKTLEEARTIYAICQKYVKLKNY